MRVLIALFTIAVAGFGQDLATAEKLYWDQDFQQAEQVLRDLLAKESDDVADAHFRLAMTLLARDELQEAEQQISAATAAGLSEEKVSLAQGRRAMAQKQFPEARASLTAAIETNPEDAEAYYFRGLAFAATNDFKSAVPDFDKSQPAAA